MQGEPAPAAAPPAPAQAAQQASVPSGAPSLAGTVRSLVAELGMAFHDRLQLLSLEVRKAGLALAEMVMLAVLAALLISAAWLALMVGVFMGGTAWGLHWSLALLVVLLANLGAAAALWWRVIRLTTALTLPATVRTMQARSATTALDTSTAPTPQVQGAEHG